MFSADFWTQEFLVSPESHLTSASFSLFPDQRILHCPLSRKQAIPSNQIIQISEGYLPCPEYISFLLALPFSLACYILTPQPNGLVDPSLICLQVILFATKFFKQTNCPFIPSLEFKSKTKLNQRRDPSPEFRKARS